MANIPEFLASKIESIQKQAMHIIFATCSCDEALSGLSLTTLHYITCVRSTLQDYRMKTTRYTLFSLSFSMSPHTNGTRHLSLIYQCDSCLVPLENEAGKGWG